MRDGRTVFWHLAFPFLVVSALGVIATAWFLTSSVTEMTQERDFADLRLQAEVIEKLISEKFSPDQFPKIDAALKELAPSLRSRVTVVLPPGEVIADSQEDLSRVEDLSARPEIRDAL